MGKFLIAILIIALCAGVGWAVTAGIVYLICLCFNLHFSLLIATGIWLALVLASWWLKDKSKKE